MGKAGRIRKLLDWIFLAALLLMVVIVSYKAFGEFGKAFIITIIILGIMYTLVEVLSYKGLFLKIKLRKNKK